MRIGGIARKSGCTVATIRFYEASGLLPPASRSASGQRMFGHEDVARLKFIRRARDFGMPIDLVRRLLEASADSETACGDARDVIGLQLAEIGVKRRELAQLEASLQLMAQRCDDTCKIGACDPCTIFTDISRYPPAEVPGDTEVPGDSMRS